VHDREQLLGGAVRIAGEKLERLALLGAKARRTSLPRPWQPLAA